MVSLLVSKENYERVSEKVRSELVKMSAGRTIFVSSAFREGDNKEHGKGLALDIICPEMELLDFYILATRFDWVGIGVYPDWQINGDICGGLHVDMREANAARWMGVKEKGVQAYIALSKNNLKEHGII